MRGLTYSKEKEGGVATEEFGRDDYRGLESCRNDGGHG